MGRYGNVSKYTIHVPEMCAMLSACVHHPFTVSEAEGDWEALGESCSCL